MDKERNLYFVPNLYHLQNLKVYLIITKGFDS